MHSPRSVAATTGTYPFLVKRHVPVNARSLFNGLDAIIIGAWYG